MGIRNIETGEYLHYNEMLKSATEFNIPIVDIHHTNGHTINILQEKVRELTEEEGVVIRFLDGHMVKVKGDWYVAIHKSKENILFDRDVVDMILEETIDDVKSHLDDDDKKSIETFEDEFWKHFKENLSVLREIQEIYNDKKEFALNGSSSYKKGFHSLFFMCFDGKEEPFQALKNQVKKNLNSNISWEKYSNEMFGGIKRD